MIRHLSVILLFVISAGLALADDARPPLENNAAQSGTQPWWSDAGAGWIGGGGGSAVGLIGALFGTLAGLGVARSFTLFLCIAMTVLGAVTLIAGIAAVVLGQPYHVYYPCLLLGGISAFVFGLNYPGVKRRYEQRELQRMTALDS